MKQTLPIKGMNCASCAITIEKTLKKQEGVISCEANFGNEKAKIEFDPSKTNIQKLSKTIEPFGYSLMSNGSEHMQGDHIDHSKMSPEKHAKMMGHEGMDHSEHLGINQSKEEKLKELNEQKNKLKLALPVTAFVFVYMLWEILAMIISGFPKPFVGEDLYQKTMLIMSTIILFWIGGGFLKEVIVFIKYRVANMYTLIGIGTFVAWFYSSLVTIFPELIEALKFPDATYFDVTIVVVGFVFLGRYLETRSKLMTGEAIEKLLNLQAKTAIVERSGKEIEISVQELKINDIVIVKPGGKIPVDGVIIEGSSSIDESMITGEPIPVDKAKNDTVIGGTINKHGSFKFRATKIGSETMLSQIIKMVEEAQGSKAPIQGLADKISEVFVPAVLVIALITLLSWLFIGPIFIPSTQALSLGILCFVGVLVIACPCALGLATPTAIIVGTGKGAENGILVKNAEALEILNKVTTIVTDKTGTITKGEPVVSDIVVFDKDLNEKDFLEIVASLEKNSEHPIAKAILEKAKSENLKVKIEDFKVVEGKGLMGKINGKKYEVGNLKFMRELKVVINQDQIDTFLNQGKTLVFVSSMKKLIGLITISDDPKENISESINELHRLGIKVVMLTGDNENAAKYIADKVGIDEIIADVLPSAKADVIKDLQDKGEIVAMVGDGINDAPALAQANVGIAMGTGTDVAIESASVTLLQGDFNKVLKAIKLSRFTLRAIKQNLFWAFAYNILGIPLAAGLFFPFFGIILNPIFAGLAMALSSVSVVSNSLRLKSKRL